MPASGEMVLCLTKDNLSSSEYRGSAKMTDKRFYFFKILSFLWVLLTVTSIYSVCFADPIIIDHTCTNIREIPESAINQAKTTLHIAYGHTSHGSQLTDGMTGLVGFVNNGGLGLNLPTDLFAWNNGGSNSALDLHDYFAAGDLGNPDRSTWAQRTRTYLDNPANADVNVIIWSWCGQVDTTEENIDLYLSLMNQLEIDYPNVKFVYMTGHANGSGEAGNVHLRNRQIRNFCIANNKILYDFYDIECYNPDGEYFGDKYVLDSCGYDSNGDSNAWNDGANWAIEWETAHTEGVDWYTCVSAHSQPLNANRKAYTAWWLWVRLAGWNGEKSSDDDGDGMPDVWEVQYGLNPLVNDASGDKDGDRFSNLREYRARTNPTDPASKPRPAMPWFPLLLDD